MSGSIIRTLCLPLAILAGTLSLKGEQAGKADAAQLYSDGKYEEAAAIWKAMEPTSPSAALYFNLGLAYAKLGQSPEAIYSFEQGLRMKPMHSSLWRVLETERKKNKELTTPVDPFFLAQWYKGYRMALRPGIWVFLGLCFLFTVILYLLCQKGVIPLRAFIKGNWPAWIAACGLLMIFTGIASYSYLHKEDEAIVMRGCEMRQAPAVESPALRTLPPGEKIVIRDALGEWYHVTLPNLDEGWVEKSCNKIIRIPQP